MRDLLHAVELLNGVDVIERRREAAVRAKELLSAHAANKPRKGKVIKQIGEALPNIRGTVLSKALIVEPVDLRDLSALVVPAQDRHPRGVADLQAHDERRRLE